MEFRDQLKHLEETAQAEEFLRHSCEMNMLYICENENRKLFRAENVKLLTAFHPHLQVAVFRLYVHEDVDRTQFVEFGRMDQEGVFDRDLQASDKAMQDNRRELEEPQLWGRLVMTHLVLLIELFRPVFQVFRAKSFHIN